MIGSVMSASAMAVAGGAPAATNAEQARSFEQAMERQTAGESVADAALDPAAAERARAGLGLESAPPAAPGGGDMILEGMQKLRGIFDAREDRVSGIMSRANMDGATMVEMQLELANFTLMVDMASKLTGKSTQVFDTLMKGQ